MGRVINDLVASKQSSGYKSIQWNAKNNKGEPVSAGVYLYSIEAGEFRQTKKMILLKQNYFKAKNPTFVGFLFVG